MSYCSSCRNYSYDGRGACGRCYEKVRQTSDDLKRENEELKAKVEFLRFWSLFDHPNQSEDFRKLYTDVVLVATSKDKDGGGQSESAAPIPAHKSVLVSRSRVFKAMLESEMETKRGCKLEISDVSYDALCAFVNYLYTAEASLDEKLACDLLELAERYEVEHLKACCEKFLISELNWDNSVMRFEFAHQNNAFNLLYAAIAMITNDMTKFIQREEYKELVKKDPRLVVEIFEAYLCKQTKIAGPHLNALIQLLFCAP